MADYRDTLILPFEKGLLDFPTPGANWTLLNARPLPDFEGNWRQSLTCEQGFRGDYLALKNMGYTTEPNLEALSEQDGMLIIANRSRQVNEDNLTRAWNTTKQGGIVVFAGNKNAGVQPIRKWAAKRTEIAGSLSKHHAVVFWVVKNGENWPLSDLPEVQEEYLIAPGMFSASGPDAGSRLLADQFGNHIRGRVADFGAGWGYLSAELLKHSNSIETLELFEADWQSLEAAKQNVRDRAKFHWVDLTAEPPRGPYNWIIMNPPFHTGRAAEPKLGNTFIAAAAKALPSGGRLLMVANTNLPYEKTLSEHFKKVERKVQAGGFKIIEAVR